jgi:TM2 domain-containing membrane protein YozV
MNNTECNNGLCEKSQCQCNPGYASFKGTCNYEQKEKLTAFCLSFFIGLTGADWFYLSCNNREYITKGVFKLFSLLLFIFNIIMLLTVAKTFLMALGLTDTNAVIVEAVITIITTLFETWWLVDWIRILKNDFKDGNNISLKDW